MDSFLSFVIAMNTRSKGRNVVASIRFSSDVEVIFCKIWVLSKKCLIFERKFTKSELQ